MAALVLSIIVASTTAVGKVFLIGLVGALSCKFPKHSPLIPPSCLSVLSRMTFNMLILPLIYTGVASSVHLDELQSLYPIILISLAILFLSYTVTVCIGYLPCFAVQREAYFVPLCISSTFPNIVAFPIILFPILCEYEVVQDLVREDIMDVNDSAAVDKIIMDESSLIDVCEKQTNAVVFTYFFGFSLVLWSFGHRTLVNINKAEVIDRHDADMMSATTGHSPSIIRRTATAVKYSAFYTKDVFIDVIKSPGFVALILGFITVCISPLQRALFQTGGFLRVVGSALESSSSAATTFGTIIVAASLMEGEEDRGDDKLEGEEEQVEDRGEELPNGNNRLVSQNENHEDKKEASNSKLSSARTTVVAAASLIKIEENRGKEGGRVEEEEIQSGREVDDRFIENGNHERNKEDDHKTTINHRFNCFQSISSKTLKIHIWQITARLFVTPGIVFFLLIRLDCAGLLDSIPNIAKLVLLLNSAVPGALVVVVILKANGFTREADAVSKTYLPTYVLSVLTIAMWSTFGLMAFRQDSTVC